MNLAVRLYPGTAVLLLLLAGCGSKTGHQFSREAREDGVELVTNSGGPKYAQPVYDVKETLRLGDEEEPKLFQAGGFVVDNDGYLYFTDEDRIKKFDPDGSFLMYISRQGQGPGEISYPMLHSVRGDTLLVTQSRRSGYAYRLDFFLLDGTFVKRLLVPQIEENLVEDAWNHVSDYLGADRVLFTSNRTWNEGDIQKSETAYGFADTEGGFVRALDVKDDPRNSGLFFQGETYAISMSRPFTGYFRHTFDDSSLIFLYPEGHRLKVFNYGGDLRRVIMLDLPLPAVSERDIQEVLQEYNSRNDGVKIGRQHIPDKKPLTCSVVIADDGCLWLKKGEHMRDWGGKEPITYMIIDTNGEYIADQILPIALSVVKNGYAYGFCTNEDDLRIFKRLKLVKKQQ